MNSKPVIAVVTTNEDPAKAGRIKVALPQLDGQEYPEWIEPVFVPGWFSPPEVGDAVEVEVPEGEDLVEFANEVRYRGQVFDDGHLPPDKLKQQQKKVHLRGYFTKAGHLLLFNDKSGSEEISITEGKSGNTIGITGKGQIYIKNEKAGSKIILEPTGAITIAPGSPCNIEATQTNLNGLTASTDFIIKGTTFNLAVQALHQLWNSELAALKAALEVWGALTPGIPATTDMLIAFATAVKTPVENLISGLTTYSGAVAGFTSLMTKTG